MLTSLSVDKILFPRYAKYSTNFGGLSFNGDMAPSCLQDMNFVFIEVHIKPMRIEKSWMHTFPSGFSTL